MSPTNPPSGKPGDAGGSRPGKADWRSKAKTPAGSRPAGAPGGTWREKTDVEYRRAKRRHRQKLIGLLAGSVALVAWLAYLLVSPQFSRRTPFFAVIVTEYGPSTDSPGYSLIPPNGWAKEDTDRFQALADGKVAEYSGVQYVVPSETVEEGFQKLREGIKKSKKRWALGPGRDTVIVYLSVHGVVDERGHACLIPPGVSPLESKKCFQLDEVLRYLFLEDEKVKLPAHKLVILDCNRMDANWGLGLLYNGFADDLEAAIGRADVDGLVILNSTSPVQIGWTSPEQFQGSVFGYYVWLGLMGEADREKEYWPGRDGYYDGRVSLEELCRYVSTHVQSWVQAHRADAQVPMLVRRKDEDKNDFALVHALTEKELAKVKKEWAPKEYERDPRWERVAELWKTHEKLEKKTAWRNDPLGWEEFQHGLLHLERLVSAGEAYDNEFDKRWDKLKDLADKLGKDPLAPSVRAYSLPLASKFSADPGIDKEKAVRLRAQWAAQRAKPPGKSAAEAGGQYPYLVAATAGRDWCLEHPEGERWPDRLALVEKARQAQKGRKADVIEWHFVRMLQNYLDLEVRKAPADLVKQALLARQAAESAAAPGDERVHYWLHNLVDKADADRRVAEDALFVGSPADLRQAKDKFAAAIGKDQSPGKYAVALSHAKEISDAFALRDLAWARTPYLAEWVLARLHERDPVPPDQLNTLIKATQELGRQLDAELANQREEASGEAGPLPARVEAQKKVQQALDTLDRAYENECRLVERTWRTDRRILRRLSTVLAVPLVTGKDREGLRGGYLDILESAQRAQAPANAEAAGADDRVAAGEQAAGQQDTGLRFLDRLAQWSEHPALAMLSRAGLQDDESLPRKPAAAASELPAGAGDSQRAAQEKKKLADQADQGEKVRGLLATAVSAAEDGLKQTEAKLKLKERMPPAAETRSGASKADRLLRASAAMLHPWTEPGTDPVSQLRRLDLHYLLLWQCHRTLDDFWGPARNDRGGEKSYFDVVAGEYLASAKGLYESAAKGWHYEKWDRLLAERRIAAHDPVVAKIVEDPVVVPKDAATSLDLDAVVSESNDLPPGKAALYLESDPEKRALPVFASAAEADPKNPPRAGPGRVAIPVPGGAGKSATSSYWVLSDDFHLGGGSEKAKDYQAVALYRGHRVENTFTASLGAGVQIVYQPRVDPTFVTVTGDQRAESYVIFILDYSGSMLTELSQEGVVEPGDKSGRRTTKGARYRYQSAREALLRILRTLAVPETPYRVAVMLYGHRYNYPDINWGKIPVPEGAKKRVKWDLPSPREWDPEDPPRLISGDDDRPEVSPSADIQVIWPPTERPEVLTGPAVDAIESRLKKYLPTGETPLYLAIMDAIDRLSKVGGTSSGGVAPSKHIVVITDGANYQSDNKDPKIYREKDHVKNKFLDAGSGIRLDVILFSLSDKEAAEVNDLKSLAVNHGLREDDQPAKEVPTAVRGKWYRADRSSQLVENLNESLRLFRFKVYRDAPKAEETAKALDLGKSLPVSKSDLEKIAKDDLANYGGVPFVVKLVGSSQDVQTKIALQGGESIVLSLGDGGTRLDHARYDKDRRQFRPDVVDPLDSSRHLYIAAHEPLVKDGVHFYFSIQNSNEKDFSRRPVEAWVEIRPVMKNPAEAAPLYVFYDVQFKPNCPVPVLECTAPDWPDEAEEADVRLWCKFKETPHDADLPLDQFKPKKPPGLRSLELRQSDKKQDLHEVIVTARYDRGGDLPKQISTLKVEMVPRAPRAVHDYIREARMVQHTFTYPSETFRSGQTPPQVRITLRDEALKGALEVPLRVRVPLTTARPR